MPLEKSEAILLKAHNWSESSRTLVFFTKEYGKLALVDKGGRAISSKRGRALSFARLEVSFYSSQKESSGYISDVELLEEFSLTNDGSLGRLAYASAACETLNELLAEHEPQPMLFTYLMTFFQHINTAPKTALSSLFITFFLRMLSTLGYHPSLAYCVSCSKPAEQALDSDGYLAFSPERGGLVCPSCGRPTDYYIRFHRDPYMIMAALQTASLGEAVAMPTGHADALSLLEGLTKFLSYQTGVRSELKSLLFLEKLRTSLT